MKKSLALLLSVMMVLQMVLPLNLIWAAAETTTATDIGPVVTDGEVVQPTATPTVEPAADEADVQPTDPPAETASATEEPAATPTAEPATSATAKPTAVLETETDNSTHPGTASSSAERGRILYLYAHEYGLYADDRRRHGTLHHRLGSDPRREPAESATGHQ